jgi:ABC-2 type transport system permease protein
MFSLNGFFAFYSLYLVLAASIMASYFGILLMGREKICKTSDFLMTRPQSRVSLFAEKLLAGVASLMLINTILISFLAFMFHLMDTTGSSFSTYMLLCSTLVVIQLMMFSIGVVLGVFIPRIRVPAGIAASVAFTFFIIGMVYGLIKSDSIRFFAPFQYINTDYIVKNGHYEWPWLALAVVVMVVPVIVSAVWFSRRDIDSV